MPSTEDRAFLRRALETSIRIVLFVGAIAMAVGHNLFKWWLESESENVADLAGVEKEAS